MKNKKYSKWVIIITAMIIMMYWLSNIFAPGSYPNAEKYELDYSEKQVIIAINKFKEENPEYKVPKTTIDNKIVSELIDGRDTTNGYWYFFYFYYKKENKIIFTWTRSSEKNKTTFAFVSVNYGLNLGNWRDINKDLNFFKSQAEKKEFEERILKKIKERLH